jgi:hypothetical protein
MITTQATASDLDHGHTLPALLSTVRDELRAQLARRAAHKQLSRELSTYHAPAELDDLYAILDRYDEDQVADIRRILRQNRAA